MRNTKIDTKFLKSLIKHFLKLQVKKEHQFNRNFNCVDIKHISNGVIITIYNRIINDITDTSMEFVDANKSIINYYHNLQEDSKITIEIKKINNEYKTNVFYLSTFDKKYEKEDIFRNNDLLNKKKLYLNELIGYTHDNDGVGNINQILAIHDNTTGDFNVIHNIDINIIGQFSFILFLELTLNNLILKNMDVLSLGYRNLKTSLSPYVVGTNDILLQIDQLRRQRGKNILTAEERNEKANKIYNMLNKFKRKPILSSFAWQVASGNGSKSKNTLILNIRGNVRTTLKKQCIRLISDNNIKVPNYYPKLLLQYNY